MTPAETLRALLAKATPGPWKYRDDRLDTGRILIAPGNDDLLTGYDDYQDEENAKLICEMYDALPALLDVAEAAQLYKESVLARRATGEYTADMMLANRAEYDRLDGLQKQKRARGEALFALLAKLGSK